MWRGWRWLGGCSPPASHGLLVAHVQLNDLQLMQDDGQVEWLADHSIAVEDNGNLCPGRLGMAGFDLPS